MTHDASKHRSRPAESDKQPSTNTESPPTGGSAALWDKVTKLVRESLAEHSHTTWIATLRPVSWSRGTLRVEAPNEFHAGWVEDKYGQAIADAASRIAGAPVDLEVAFKPGGEDEPPELAVQPVGRPGAQSDAEARAEPCVAESGPVAPSPDSASVPPRTTAPAIKAENTFDRFVVSQNNQLAHAACLAVADHPTRRYNPLFLVGATGMGKTHIMQAIANRSAAAGVHRRIGYFTAERFLNDMVDAIAKSRTQSFRDRYRSCDLLLVDDVQFLKGKDRTQQEFFHTYNELHHRDYQIVMSSDRHPKDLDGMQARLVSRFESGLVVEIKPPDYETRLAIARMKVRERAVPGKPELPDQAVELVAQHCTRSVRQLEGAVIKLVWLSSLPNARMDLPMVRRALDLHNDGPPTPAAVVERVAKEWRVSAKDLASRRQSQNIVRPRQVAMYLIRKLFGVALAAIGQLFGGRDHSTVLHSIRKVESLMRADPSFRQTVESLRAEFESAP